MIHVGLNGAQTLLGTYSTPLSSTDSTTLHNREQLASMTENIKNQLFNLSLTSTLTFAQTSGSKGLVSRGIKEEKSQRQKLLQLIKEYFDLKFAKDAQYVNNIDKNPERILSLSNIPYIKKNLLLKDNTNLVLYEAIYPVHDTWQALTLIRNRKDFVRFDGQTPEDCATRSWITNTSYSPLGLLLKGNRHEEILHHPKSRALSSDFWDHWWKVDGNNSGDIARDYIDFIHPMIFQPVLKILNSLVEPKTTPIIMEIGGGLGILAKEILEQHRQNVNYILLERNRPSLETARKNLNQFSRVTIIETDLVHDQAYYCDPTKSTEIPTNSVDIVLGSGILTYQVLDNKQEALTVLVKVHCYLKAGGYLILAGCAHSRVDAEDLTRTGFHVINKTCATTGRQLYIAQKSDNLNPSTAF